MIDQLSRPTRFPRKLGVSCQLRAGIVVKSGIPVKGGGLMRIGDNMCVRFVTDGLSHPFYNLWYTFFII